MTLTTQKFCLCNKKIGYTITPEMGDVYDIDCLVENMGNNKTMTCADLMQILHNNDFDFQIVKGVLVFKSENDAAKAIKVLLNI